MRRKPFSRFDSIWPTLLPAEKKKQRKQDFVNASVPTAHKQKYNFHFLISTLFLKWKCIWNCLDWCLIVRNRFAALNLSNQTLYQRTKCCTHTFSAKSTLSHSITSSFLTFVQVVDCVDRKASLSDRFNSFALRTIAFSRLFFSFSLFLLLLFCLSTTSIEHIDMCERSTFRMGNSKGQSLENVIVGTFTCENYFWNKNSIVSAQYG